MRDESCIFCKIIEGKIPSNTIYEDEDFKVILDISPASKGHALLLPKEHYADIYEIDEDVLGDGSATMVQFVLNQMELRGKSVISNKMWKGKWIQ